MAGHGFSIGATSGGGANPPNEIPQESFFLYRNEEIAAFNTTKGFELWQQHIQRQQSQHHHHIYTSALDAGPSRSTNVSDESSSRAHHHHMMMRGGGGGSSSSGKSCQDCGNQAKKDCLHMRCRTCCKSRGFQCPTHVKSTWVPAARRRERQQQLQAVHLLRGGGGGDHNSKRLRENPNNNPTTTIRLPTTAAGLQLGNFPAEVNSQAVFRCVRVSGMSEAQDSSDEYAYHAAVSIGGHVFKGLLYDQGPEGRYDTSSGTVAQPQQQNTNTSNAGGNTNSNQVMDPSSLYPTPLNAFVAGTQFFPHPRS